jgi:S-adenosyl methyltransferase
MTGAHSSAACGNGDIVRGVPEVFLHDQFMKGFPVTTDDAGIDTSVPHSARIWNYWLGGTDNYPVDQAAGDQFGAIYPGIVDIARADRAFLGRVVRYLAGPAGVRQFLDVGAGLPTAVNTHEAANQVTPDARTVYVDNDPLVVAHAAALLASGPPSRTYFVNASMGDPDLVLREAASRLDLTQPVGLTLMGVLGHVTDYAEAKSIVTGLLAGLPSGSYLAINDSIDTSEALEQALRVYEASGAVPYRTRSRAEFTAYFDGLELVEPGVVLVDDWRPDPGVLRGPEIPQLGAVGRKRASLCSRNSTPRKRIRPGSTTSTWAGKTISPWTGKPG